MKDESKSAGWPGQASPALSAEEEAGGGGCHGMGLSWHPEVGRPWPGVPAGHPQGGGVPSPRWHPLHHLCGSHGAFPCCQPGQRPAGQGPGGVTRVEGSGEGLLRGMAASQAWPLAPLRRAPGRNAAFLECLAFNPGKSGAGKSPGEEEAGSVCGLPLVWVRPERTGDGS